jgi:hypothetical protein
MQLPKRILNMLNRASIKELEEYLSERKGKQFQEFLEAWRK